ncbi:MAG TPA: nucleoside recognition domain-containing protein [Chthoniobacteraceae bacterium]|jgi:spore maturation protein SpmA/spore maturation protein SpmB
MLNYIWLGLILAAVAIAGITGRVKEMTDGAIDSSKTAVTLALGLIGIMALWLGVMRLAEKSGLVQVIAGAIRPLMKWLFPDVPAQHPAMGSMVMNIAANMLGLANAATPLGLRAMKDLERLNPHPGTATNAMCTFLAINTSSVQLIPATAVAVLASAGSANPTAIIGTAFLATLCSTAAGITSVRLLEKLPVFRAPAPAPKAVTESDAEENAEVEGSAPLRRIGAWGYAAMALLFLVFATMFVSQIVPEWFGRPASAEAGNILIRSVGALSLLAIPFVLAFFPAYAALRGLPVYEEFVEGAKEGFHTSVRIIPFLVTILVAIGMFRGAGGLDILSGYTDAEGVRHAGWLSRPLEAIGFPPDLLPMALIRPLSGSGSLGALSDLVKNLGPDHLITLTAATVFGSTETTFYVIAVYFGSVAVRRTRHAVPAGLIADAVGIIASIAICRMMFT